MSEEEQSAGVVAVEPSPPQIGRILRLSQDSWVGQPGTGLQRLLSRELGHELELKRDEVDMVLSQIIWHEVILTATNADVLAGSQLDQPGVPGVYTIWTASTVGDSTISVTFGGRTIINGGAIVLRANSEIRENEDNFVQVLSRTGGRPVINIIEVTAASIRVRVAFIPTIPS